MKHTSRPASGSAHSGCCTFLQLAMPSIHTYSVLKFSLSVILTKTVFPRRGVPRTRNILYIGHICQVKFMWYRTNFLIGEDHKRTAEEREGRKVRGRERGSIKIWGRGKKRRECEVSKDRVFLSFLVLNKNGIKVTEELWYCIDPPNSYRLGLNYIICI